jgi:hypothetical protein
VSIRATNFVRHLRGLSSSEKAVAFVHADHARLDPDAHNRLVSGVTYASMSTVAEEAGLKNRESASRITKRLLEKRVLVAEAERPGVPTVYRLNLDPNTCDCTVTGQAKNPVTARSHRVPPTRDSVAPKPVTPEKQTCDSPVTQRVEELREGVCSLMQSSQDQQKQQEPVPFSFQIKNAIGKAAKLVGACANDDQRKHLEDGIFRKKIDAAYFDANRARMKPNDCVREALKAGVVSLMSNRSVELRGLRDKDLEANAWERLRPGLDALREVKDSRHVIHAVTNCLTSVAFEFWQRQNDARVANG